LWPQKGGTQIVYRVRKEKQANGLSKERPGKSTKGINNFCCRRDSPGHSVPLSEPTKGRSRGGSLFLVGSTGPYPNMGIRGGEGRQYPPTKLMVGMQGRETRQWLGVRLTTLLKAEFKNNHLTDGVKSQTYRQKKTKKKKTEVPLSITNYSLKGGIRKRTSQYKTFLVGAIESHANPRKWESFRGDGWVRKKPPRFEYNPGPAG